MRRRSNQRALSADAPSTDVPLRSPFRSVRLTVLPPPPSLGKCCFRCSSDRPLQNRLTNAMRPVSCRRAPQGYATPNTLSCRSRAWAVAAKDSFEIIGVIVTIAASYGEKRAARTAKSRCNAALQKFPPPALLCHFLIAMKGSTQKLPLYRSRLFHIDMSQSASCHVLGPSDGLVEKKARDARV